MLNKNYFFGVVDEDGIVLVGVVEIDLEVDEEVDEDGVVLVGDVDVDVEVDVDEDGLVLTGLVLTGC